MPVAAHPRPPQTAHAQHQGACVHKEDPLWLRVVTLDTMILRRVILGLFSLALILPILPGYPGITCPLRAVTGIPCPFCGTTTAVGEAAHLNLAESLRTNPGPLVALAIAAVLFVLRPARLRVPVSALIALLAAMWVVQLFRFS
jgi:Protein of unknown function (DUF2752)